MLIAAVRRVKRLRIDPADPLLIDVIHQPR
jgi:hypothetical protein